jgi:hypothetical protein
MPFSGVKAMYLSAALLFWPASVLAAPPEIARILTLPDYWEAATPDQVRKLVAGHSLADVRTYEKYTPDSSRTPLMLAAESTPHPEIIDILVRAGSDVNAVTNWRTWFRSPGSVAISGHTADISAALHFAVLNPNPAILRALLRHQPNLDARRACAPVHYSALELAAIRAGRTEHLKLLLEAGARPTPEPGEEPAKYSIWRFFLGFDNFFFHRAPLSDEGFITGILLPPDEAAAKTKLLLAHGVTPDLDALGRALASGHNEAARMLLDAGVVTPPGKLRARPCSTTPCSVRVWVTT